jgi:hypothetical protein
MFGLVDATGLQPHEISFLGPVLYDRAAIFARHDAAVRTAATIFKVAADQHPDIMADKANGLPFMKRLAKELIASPLIWSCITSKEHARWAREREIRLIVMAKRKTSRRTCGIVSARRNVSPTSPTRFGSVGRVPLVKS